MPRQIQVHQGKLTEHVLFVLEQAPIPHLGITELALEDPERMFDGGTQRRQQAVQALLFRRRVAAFLAFERHDQRGPISSSERGRSGSRVLSA